MTKPPNRRDKTRIAVDLPMKFKQEDREASQIEDTGTIQNMSATGLYFFAHRNFEAGEKIEFFIELQQKSEINKGVVLHYMGNILRAEDCKDETGQVGVAARIDRYQILSPDAAD